MTPICVPAAAGECGKAALLEVGRFFRPCSESFPSFLSLLPDANITRANKGVSKQLETLAGCQEKLRGLRRSDLAKWAGGNCRQYLAPEPAPTTTIFEKKDLRITMDVLIDSRLAALETALATLVDSITSYNPSIPAANAILKADSDLQDSLKQLAQHQRNNQRITSLRQTISAQNDAITSQLTLLADVRKELLDIPTSLPQKNRREVSHDEVLSYAKRIARFTMPPGMKPATTTTTTVKAEGMEEGGATKPSEGRGMKSLEEFERQWLDPWTGVQFTPWPGEEVIKRGALGEIQAMVEKGLDPATMRVGEEVGRKEEDMSVDESEGGDGQGQMMRVERREEKPKVFGGLDLYDPDEEG